MALGPPWPLPPGGCPPGLFAWLAAEVEQHHGLALLLIDAEGQVVEGAAQRLALGSGDAGLLAALAREATRWGGPAILPGPDDHLLMAVPVMLNGLLLGALVTGAAEAAVFPDATGQAAIDLPAIGRRLLAVLLEHRLSDGATLAAARSALVSEQQRAYLLHEHKHESQGIDVLAAYLRLEPDLLSAVRRGDRSTAVHLLNRVLVLVWARAVDDETLVKSLLLELVAAMTRAAIEGGASGDLLAGNLERMASLAAASGEEALSTSLVTLLDQLLDAIANTGTPGDGAARRAVAWIEDHAEEPVTRDDVAAAVGLSPSELSRRLRAATGHTFTELLNRIRIDRAAVLLRTTETSLVDIALGVGFSDQSWFTKVFRRHTGRTPGDYRRQHGR